MKLRIKGNSLRLRVGPLEVQRLMDSGRIEETIHFAPGVHLTYALEHSETAACVSTSHTPGEVAVIVPTSVAQAWANGDDVGIHAAVPNGTGSLEVAIEKDFACLDSSHAGNLDTFPNPKAAC
ncbi:MAG: hypothetical protein ABSA85_17200 [Terracidiphilus sp.]|jgi:hypothetical protein